MAFACVWASTGFFRFPCICVRLFLDTGVHKYMERDLHIRFGLEVLSYQCLCLHAYAHNLGQLLLEVPSVPTTHILAGLPQARHQGATSTQDLQMQPESGSPQAENQPPYSKCDLFMHIGCDRLKTCRLFRFIAVV